jgi:NAD-dependent histone deacetylase SIR2
MLFRQNLVHAIIVQLPPNFFRCIGQLHDADLLIVIGTSLTVHPFASLIDMVGGKCPRVLINLDKVGGIGSGKNDMVLLGKCDDIIRDLARELGWEDELEKEWAGTAASLDTDKATPTTATEEKGRTDGAELALEIEKIVEKVESTLSISEKDKPPAVVEADASTRAGVETREDTGGKERATTQIEKIPDQEPEEGERSTEREVKGMSVSPKT